MDIIMRELNDFGKSLRQDDKIVYERMLKRSLGHIGSISYADSFHVWAFILLSIMLEQEKEHESMADRRLQEQG